MYDIGPPPPITISIMLACYVSPANIERHALGEWYSPAAVQSRRWLQKHGLIDGNHRATPDGEAWVKRICATPPPGSGSRIIEGLRQDVNGDLATVTVEGQTWVRKDRSDRAEIENFLANPILSITLGSNLEGKITEQEALALVNASRACLLAGVQAMKEKRDG